MIGFIKKLFSGAPAADFKELVRRGALIIDVRTPGEFASGHIKGAVNIPVDQLSKNLQKLQDKNRPIITCCASGMRSASARGILSSKGYTQVYNGGGWTSLQSKLS